MGVVHILLLILIVLKVLNLRSSGYRLWAQRAGREEDQVEYHEQEQE